MSENAWAKKKRRKALFLVFCRLALAAHAANATLRDCTARTAEQLQIVVRLFGLQRLARATVDPLTQLLARLEVRHVLLGH